MKVRIKDFQSIKDYTFEFPVGVTIIQGKTDSGKTTVFYAIDHCLTNPPGVADVINWDAKQAEVTIENNGGYVKWIKTPSSCEYEDRDGKPYTKASKLDSRDIDDLGFYFDKKDKVINIHSEWDKLFPFDSSDTEMFKLFEDIFNISSSFQIIDSIKKDEQEKKQKAGQIADKINLITKQNNEIDGILSSIDLNLINAQITRLENAENAITELKKDYNTFLQNKKYSDIKIPDNYNSEQLQLKFGNYQNILKDYNNYLKGKSFKSLPEQKTFNLKENPYKEDYSVYIQELNNIKNYESELRKLELIEQDLLEKKKLIKVCPTCGRPLEECNE